MITHHVGDALEVMRELPDASVDLIASSPPFLALRDYNGVDGQWGQEPDPAAFLDNLLALATESRRVLTEHGSLVFELGDTYSGSGGAGGDYNDGGLRESQLKFSGSAAKRRANGIGDNFRPSRSGRVKENWPLPKSLTCIPTLFGSSLAYGRNLLNPDHEFDRWRLRNRIVWSRNNPAVGALGDKFRPATSYITVACVSGKRWFDLDAVRGAHKSDPAKFSSIDNTNIAAQAAPGGDCERFTAENRIQAGNPNGAPPLDHWHDEYDGDVEWLINTAGSKLAHYAMWPARLAERLVLSMCPPGGTVLDPFYGSGTTGAVADLHGRHAIGIDIDPANSALHAHRYAEVEKALFPSRPTQIVGQRSLLADDTATR